MNSPEDNETHQGPQLCILLIKQQSCCKDWPVSRNKPAEICVCVFVYVGGYLVKGKRGSSRKIEQCQKGKH